MPDPRKTPFEVFRNRTRSERAIRLSHSASDAPGHEPASSQRSATFGGSNWMSQPVRLRLTPAMLILCVMGVCVLVIIAYEIGHSPVASIQKQTDQRSTERVTQLRREPVNGMLLRTDGGSLETTSGDSGSAAAGQNPAVTDPDSGRIDNGDPRVPGYNYFCLATMPPKYRAEAERAVAFLKRNRVDAAVFSVNNHWLQVVALRGFDSPASQQAKEYESLLRSLGRAWKAEQHGWSDWADLYAIKYNP